MGTTAYAGKPYKGTPIAIPGRLECAYYDKGGEGVAYHDQDKVNHGSGELNKGPGELDNFRIDESVDTTYTKDAFDKFVDGTKPPINQMYVGWTNPGEWIKYTVEVAETGTYNVKFLCSSNNHNAAISFSVDDVDVTGPITIPTTGHWHIWQSIEKLTELKLTKGRHVITLHVVREGQMNFWYFDFSKK
jgi:hypothetical protein